MTDSPMLAALLVASVVALGCAGAAAADDSCVLPSDQPTASAEGSCRADEPPGLDDQGVSGPGHGDTDQPGETPSMRQHSDDEPETVGASNQTGDRGADDLTSTSADGPTATPAPPLASLPSQTVVDDMTLQTADEDAAD